MKLYSISELGQLKKDIDTFFAKLPRAQIQIQRYDPARNDGQQAKLHCIIRDIAKAAGCSEEYFKQVVLKDPEQFHDWPFNFEKGTDGKDVLLPKSESKLTKKEESNLISALYAFGAEWGVSWDE